MPIAAAAALGLVPLAVARADAEPMGGFGSWRAPHMGMRMHQRGGPGGMAIERLLANASDLGLSDAQQSKLREIRKQVPGALMPKQQLVEEARLDMQDLMAQSKSSAADLKKAHDKLIKARSELEAAQFDLRMQVREVLTPEQRDKIRTTVRGGARMRMRQQRLGWNEFDDAPGPDTELF